MSLRVFKENFVERLRGTVRDNLRRYKSQKPWTDDVPGGKSGWLSTEVAPQEKLDLRLPVGEDLKDLENAIIVHRALQQLTPVQARDPRLWTRLTHVECWDYMRARWDIERNGSDQDKAEKFIVRRYFVASNESRALVRNGLARLWWYGYLSHDANRKNPYELTGVLLSSLDITQTILERSLGRVPAVNHGFLEFLLLHKAELIGPGDDKRLRVRQLAKYLNLIGGVTLLDCLTKSEVMSQLQKEFDRIMAEQKALTT